MSFPALRIKNRHGALQPWQTYVSNGAHARTSTCIRASSLPKPIVASRYESKNQWRRRQHKLGQCFGRPGRFNVLFSTCVHTNLARVLSKYVACRKTHRRFYAHVVFVPFEKLRANPASNQRGPLNESGSRSRHEDQITTILDCMHATTCVRGAPYCHAWKRSCPTPSLFLFN